MKTPCSISAPEKRTRAGASYREQIACEHAPGVEASKQAGQVQIPHTASDSTVAN